MSLPWPRFKVATVTGYRIWPGSSGEGTSAPPGVSAHVLDRWYAHRVVATFHSEDPPSVAKAHREHRKFLGRRGAVAAAEEVAGELNALKSPMREDDDGNE